MFAGFSAELVDDDGARIFLRRGGAGPPVLLLHGFPESHVMWRDLAPVLARRFTVICADLRGYGGSDCPPSPIPPAPWRRRRAASRR